MKIYYKFFVLLLIIPGIGPLYAQEDTSKYQTEEIIVTGTRVEQKIIDIPFSVQRIDQSAWVASRKIGINDVLQNVPGLFLQSRYGNHDVRVTIRGFGSRSNTGIRGVRILLDGVPESEPDGQTRVEALDFTSIGRVEIVKGNSSSLYTKSPSRGRMSTCTDTSRRSRHRAISPALGVVPPSVNGPQSSMRCTPAACAAIAPANDSTAASTRTDMALLASRGRKRRRELPLRREIPRQRLVQHQCPHHLHGH